MLIRYAFSIKNRKVDETFHELSTLISKERFQKMQKYHFEEDRIRSLYASILVRFILKKHYGIMDEELKIGKNEYGKPILTDYPEIHFNVSHSGDWVICAFSAFPVGVDVELNREHDIEIAKRFFAEVEYKTLLKSENTSDLFIKYWTLKESYVKAEGKGMSIPFDSFSFLVSGNEIELLVEGKPCNTYQFQTYQIEDDVTVATCSREAIEGTYEVVTLDEIIRVLL